MKKWIVGLVFGVMGLSVFAETNRFLLWPYLASSNHYMAFDARITTKEVAWKKNVPVIATVVSDAVLVMDIESTNAACPSEWYIWNKITTNVPTESAQVVYTDKFVAEKWAKNSLTSNLVSRQAIVTLTIDTWDGLDQLVLMGKGAWSGKYIATNLSQQATSLSLKGTLVKNINTNIAPNYGSLTLRYNQKLSSNMDGSTNALDDYISGKRRIRTNVIEGDLPPSPQ